MTQHLDVEHEVEPQNGEQEARPSRHERGHVVEFVSQPTHERDRGARVSEEIWRTASSRERCAVLEGERILPPREAAWSIARWLRLSGTDERP